MYTSDSANISWVLVMIYIGMWSPVKWSLKSSCRWFFDAKGGKYLCEIVLNMRDNSSYLWKLLMTEKKIPCVVTAPHLNTLLFWGCLWEECMHCFSICDLARLLTGSSFGRKILYVQQNRNIFIKTSQVWVHLLHQEAAWFFSMPFIYCTTLWDSTVLSPSCAR